MACISVLKFAEKVLFEDNILMSLIVEKKVVFLGENQKKGSHLSKAALKSYLVSWEKII